MKAGGIKMLKINTPIIKLANKLFKNPVVNGILKKVLLIILEGLVDYIKGTSKKNV